MYGDIYVSDAASVVNGNVYMINTDNSDDIEIDKTKAKAGR